MGLWIFGLFRGYSLKVFGGDWIGCDLVVIDRNGPTLGNDIAFGHL